MAYGKEEKGRLEKASNEEILKKETVMCILVGEWGKREDNEKHPLARLTNEIDSA